MRIAYLDCATGISGDMTLAALIDAGVSVEAIRSGITSLNLPGVRLHTEKVVKGGFAATAIRIEHPPQHAHRHLADIEEILNSASNITASQKELARQIFLQIAEAEAKVHGSTIDRVHFHEVGAIDSIVDIIGVAIGFDLLKVNRVYCSPIPTGFGTVRIDHGICPIPAPGTAEILKGIPLKDVAIEAELTTPTGAAIVKTVVDEFGRLPPMSIQSIGYGAGTMTFPQQANLLRLFVGEMAIATQQEMITLLETNLDDVTAETIGYTRKKLEQAGALDVFSTSLQMKKNRPGLLLSVLCSPVKAEELKEILFTQTGTLGVREHQLIRTIWPRETMTVETIWGTISGKSSLLADGRSWFQPEFEDCARLADEHQLTFREVYRAAQATAVHHISERISIQPVESQHHHDHSHGHDHSHDHDHHHHDHDDHHHDHG